MIQQDFNVEHYWRVTVFYNWNCDFLCNVVNVLKKKGFTKTFIKRVLYNLCTKNAKAVTCSNIEYRVSIVIFNRHESIPDYINSIVHEAEHIKQAMLRAYMIQDAGEPPAYTIGYLVMRMYEVFRELLCQ